MRDVLKKKKDYRKISTGKLHKLLLLSEISWSWIVTDYSHVASEEIGNLLMYATFGLPYIMEMNDIWGSKLLLKYSCYTLLSFTSSLTSYPSVRIWNINANYVRLMEFLVQGWNLPIRTNVLYVKHSKFWNRVQLDINFHEWKTIFIACSLNYFILQSITLNIFLYKHAIIFIIWHHLLIGAWCIHLTERQHKYSTSLSCNKLLYRF